MITQATEADIPFVADLIARSFHDLDPTAWLVPDPDDRDATLARVFAIQVEYAFQHGHIDIEPDRHAVAVWLHSTDETMPAPERYDERLVAAAGPHVDRFRLLDEAFEAHHPHGKPHHHLVFLAAEPGHRGRGLGTGLLEHHHAHLDRAGIPAYLEASGVLSRDLYLRHGYAPHGDPFHLPDGPPMWPLWRDPA